MYTFTIAMRDAGITRGTVDHDNVDGFNLMEGFLILRKRHGTFGIPLCDIATFKALEQPAR